MVENFGESYKILNAFKQERLSPAKAQRRKALPRCEEFLSPMQPVHKSECEKKILRTAAALCAFASLREKNS